MKKSKASILAVSLIVMGVMIIIALGIASSSIQSRKSSIGSSQSNVALQNADSGVEIVMQKIRDNSSGSLSAIDSDCNGIIEAAGKYKVELKDSSVPPVLVIGCGTPVSDVATIKSTGYSSQDSRAIKVAVAAGGTCTQTFDRIIAVDANRQYAVEHRLGGMPKYVQVYYCRSTDPTCAGTNFIVQEWRWQDADHGAKYGFNSADVFVTTKSGYVYLEPQMVDGGPASESSGYYRIVACR